jgi:uncharacterized protein YndB with AHSA1/START domain
MSEPASPAEQTLKTPSGEETLEVPTESEVGQFVTIKRVFDAPRERVYRAFIEPADLERWFGPSGMTVPPGTVTVDLRVGGLFHLLMSQTDDPVHVTSLDLAFEQIVENERLVEGDAWYNHETGQVIHTQLELIFADAAHDRTTVRLTQGPYSDVMVTAAEAAWSDSLDKLDRHLRDT